MSKIKYLEMHYRFADSCELLEDYLEYMEWVATGAGGLEEPLELSMRGFIGYVRQQFFTDDILRQMMLWGALHEGRFVGALAAQIMTDLEYKDVAIMLLHLDSGPGFAHDPRELDQVLDMIAEWGATKACAHLTCTVAVEDMAGGRFRSPRARLFERNFGLKPLRLLLRKEIPHDRQSPHHDGAAG